MSLLESILARSVEGRLQLHIDQSIIEKFSDLVIPKTITGKIIENYIRRAIRKGIWRSLRVEERALLIIARRWSTIRSPILGQILRRIFAEIEVQTLRGRAILYGIFIALKSGLLTRDFLGSISKLLVIGISYLNSPPIYRCYG